MELLEKAKTCNDFGLRKRFPWSGEPWYKPWTTTVTNSSEKDFVKYTMGSLWNSCSNIERVENPYLWAAYVLRHEELNAVEEPNCIKEKIVIHATTSRNAYNIADENFDWRRAHRCRFGKGVSFAGDSRYAHKYASGKSCYIIAGISLGKSRNGSYFTTIPPIEYDTTVDGRGNVWVKYYDSDFYPYYIVE